MTKKTGFFLAWAVLLCGVIGCKQSEKAEKIQLTKEIVVQKKKETEKSLVFGVSGSESPQNIFKQYHPFVEYLSKQLGTEIKLVQRRSYLELNELVKAGRIDFARLATGAYVGLVKEMNVEILGLVVKKGSPYYQASIIVRKDSPISRFGELRHKSFAFVDPSSNSGFRYPLSLVMERKEPVDNFFSRIVFTGGHDISIHAVLNKEVDGASVSSTSLVRAVNKNSAAKGEIKTIEQSPLFARGPVVVKKDLPLQLKEQLKKILLAMHLDHEGKDALSSMKIDGFQEGDNADFDSARKMLELTTQFNGEIKKQ